MPVVLPGLLGCVKLRGSLGGDAGSLLSSLADLSTQYQNQLLLSDLGLAGRSDAGSSTSSRAAASSDFTSAPPPTTTPNATSNATQQALSLYQTLQQQGLSQLLASA